MMFLVLAVTLSLPLWGLAEGVAGLATVVALLAMLPAAALDAKLAGALLGGPLGVIYVLLWLMTAWLLTPQPDELALPWEDAGLITHSNVVYNAAYLVAAVIFAARRLEGKRRRRR